MSLFTVRIGEKPILVFDAHTAAEALGAIVSLPFLDFLRQTKRAGRPLWDGQVAPTVEPATPEQSDRWFAMTKVAEDEEGERQLNTILAVLFEPVSDPAKRYFLLTVGQAEA